MKIILLGAPGSGKGTISNYLCSKYSLEHISTGDLFRAIIKNDDDFANQVKDYVLTGKYVPDWITNQIAFDAITKANDSDHGYILDGYPRTVGQADALGTKETITNVILLNVDNEILIKRISGRVVCPKCNRIYNIYFTTKPKNNNLCDDCNVALIQRKDDAFETVKTRIDIYNEQTEPLIDYYQSKGLLTAIDATLPLEEIFKKIDDIFNCKN